MGKLTGLWTRPLGVVLRVGGRSCEGKGKGEGEREGEGEGEEKGVRVRGKGAQDGWAVSRIFLLFVKVDVFALCR
jgi:hypothetical protein